MILWGDSKYLSYLKKNCKVYFVADGADELFGGYEKYKKKYGNKEKIALHTQNLKRE